MAGRRGGGKSAHFQAMRSRVIDVAAELFARNGYASTGVADIGEAAGLARGALYYYIGSKEALLVEIHDRVMDPLLAEASAVSALELSVEARLRLLSESLLWQIIHRHDHVWVFLHEYRQLLGEGREDFRDKRRRFEVILREILDAGRRVGLVGVADGELVTLAFLNLHNYTYQWLGNRVLDVEDTARFYCGLFLRGVAAEAVDGPELTGELARGRVSLLETRGPAEPLRTGADPR